MTSARDEVAIRPLDCGWLTGDTAVMVSGQEGRIRMPVPSFLVEHPRGTLVFDTGMHTDLLTSLDRLRHAAGMFDFELHAESMLAPRLEAAGVDPASVDVVALSHLHYDHAGGVAQVPNARMLVQAAEWAGAHDERMVSFGAYNPDDFDLGHDRLLLEGEHDVFGDGRLRLLPTPGHTAGHQSLLVDGSVLLVGDACYCRLALDHDAPPAFGDDLDRQRETFGWLREQEAAGVQLVFSHDDQQWATLPERLVPGPRAV